MLHINWRTRNTVPFPLSSSLDTISRLSLVLLAIIYSSMFELISQLSECMKSSTKNLTYTLAHSLYVFNLFSKEFILCDLWFLFPQVLFYYNIQNILFYSKHYLHEYYIWNFRACIFKAGFEKYVKILLLTLLS